MTSWPSRFRSAAATDESTPPDMATTTRPRGARATPVGAVVWWEGMGRLVLTLAVAKQSKALVEWRSHRPDAFKYGRDCGQDQGDCPRGRCAAWTTENGPEPAPTARPPRIAKTMATNTSRETQH